jgi:PilZ domain
MITDPVKNRRVDRRAKPKPSSKVVCRLGTLDLGADVAITVLDVSETGARLLVKKQVREGEEVTVCFEPLHSQRPSRLVGRVVWSIKTTEQTFVIGVRFEKRLPYKEWQSLV